MKASELRIGNWYDCFGNNHQASWATIKDLVNAPESQLWCKPIPLTEEWLVKNTIDGSPLIRIEHSGDIGLWIEKKDEHFYLTDDHDDYISLNEIQYVHQLQNLYFALTGQDLELKP